MKNKSIDYEFKQRVLNNNSDLLLKESKASMLSYSQFLLNSEGVITYSLKHKKDDDLNYEQLKQFCSENGLDKELKECERLNKAYFNRNTRLKDRITTIVESGKQPVFVTLTFRDDVINDTSEKTRRRYVSRFLKDNCSLYVANIDFGVDERYTQREHYHAVVDNEILSKWPYGFDFYERIKVSKNGSIKKMAKYITKLSNHAIKENARRSALIYSR